MFSKRTIPFGSLAWLPNVMEFASDHLHYSHQYQYRLVKVIVWSLVRNCTNDPCPVKSRLPSVMHSCCRRLKINHQAASSKSEKPLKHLVLILAPWRSSWSRASKLPWRAATWTGPIPVTDRFASFMLKLFDFGSKEDWIFLLSWV